MIRILYLYKSKKTGKWKEHEFITDDERKAVRFIRKIKSTYGYLFTGLSCLDSEDYEYIDSRI